MIHTKLNRSNQIGFWPFQSQSYGIRSATWFYCFYLCAIRLFHQLFGSSQTDGCYCALCHIENNHFSTSIGKYHICIKASLHVTIIKKIQKLISMKKRSNQFHTYIYGFYWKMCWELKNTLQEPSRWSIDCAVNWSCLRGLARGLFHSMESIRNMCARSCHFSKSISCLIESLKIWLFRSLIEMSFWWNLNQIVNYN